MATSVKAERMAPHEVSPKAVLALVLPAVGTAVLVALHVLLDPNIDPTLVAAIVGVVDALLAAAGAWLGAPGTVEVLSTPATAPPPQAVEPG